MADTPLESDLESLHAGDTAADAPDLSSPAAKLKVAMYWAASCGGCEISFLEIHHHLAAFSDAAELVFCPCLVDTKYSDLEATDDRAIDLCLFNGAIRTQENLRMAALLRRKSKILVAYGACASSGGIPGLANTSTLDELMERVYLTTPSTDNSEGVLPRPSTEIAPGVELQLPPLLPTVRSLHKVVEVDYTLPGCPPEGKQVWMVLQAVLAGDLPPPGSLIGAGRSTVCDECALEKRDRRVSRFRRPQEVVPDGETCLLEQGVVCLGPATRSGCEARCPGVNMPCRGCYGAAGADPCGDLGLKMVGVLGSLPEPGDEQEIQSVVDAIPDPVGTLERFALADSRLPQAVGPSSSEGERP